MNRLILFVLVGGIFLVAGISLGIQGFAEHNGQEAFWAFVTAAAGISMIISEISNARKKGVL
jgi:uncharacterized membrane protein HdeD (DUF308 family)